MLSSLSVFSFIMEGCLFYEPTVMTRNGTRVYYSATDLVNGYFMIVPSAISSYSSNDIYNRCIYHRWLLHDFTAMEKKFSRRKWWPGVKDLFHDVLDQSKYRVMRDNFVETVIMGNGSVFTIRLVKEEGTGFNINFNHDETYLGKMENIKLYADNDSSSSDSCIISMALSREKGFVKLFEDLRKHGRFKTGEVLDREKVLALIEEARVGKDWIRGPYDNFIQEYILPRVVTVINNDKDIEAMFPIFKSKKNAALRSPV